MSEKPISDLRRRMLECMAVRKFIVTGAAPVAPGCTFQTLTLAGVPTEYSALSFPPSLSTATSAI
jgi:hypothetical protein